MILFDEASTTTSRRELDITPMINIVFLLLIFFMLAGTIAPIGAPAIDPVRSSTGTAAPADALIVALDPTGQLSINGRQVDKKTFAAFIDQLARESTDGRSQPISIQADAGLAAERLLALMQQLRQAGLDRVTLLSVGDPRY